MMKKFKLLILLVFLVLTSCINVKDVGIYNLMRTLYLIQKDLFLMIICLNTE